MSEEMHPQEAGQTGRSMPGADVLSGAEQPPSQPVQQDDVDDCGESSDSGPMDRRTHADNGNAESPTAVDESDPVGLELDAKLEALLAKDVELSARYEVLLRNDRKTRRERRAMRAELRRLHTEEGRVLLEIKSHLARKGRGGEWAEYLRQTKPKSLSRTTADRWIKWYLDSQEQSQSEPPHAQEENAPQNGSGAFSCSGGPSPSPSSDPQQPVTTDPPSANGFDAFDDVQQVVLALKKSQAARFKAAAEFLVGKNGSETLHEAVYVTVIEAAANLGFVYSVTVAEGRNH
jgi:hypothetical protein